ncbi:MAG: hypothetical protein J6A28_04465 [Clostridia bacterium]|nr:hypothetical protein [Clostridia bacterium]
MKKGVICFALAGALALGGGLLFAGCGGPSQEKMHQLYMDANYAMSGYHGSISVIEKEGGKESFLATYNHVTGEYARIWLKPSGEGRYYTVAKLYQDGDLGLFDSDQDAQIVDRYYTEKLFREEILDNITEEVDESYENYVKELNGKIDELRGELLEEGFSVNTLYQNIAYTSLGDDRYEMKLQTSHDYQVIEGISGERYSYFTEERVVFDENTIISMEYAGTSKSFVFQNNSWRESSKEEYKSATIITLAHDDAIQNKIDLGGEESKPIKAMNASVQIFVDGSIKFDEDVACTSLVKQLVEDNIVLPENGKFEYYLDAQMTMLMPDDMRLNTAKTTQIFLKTVAQDGFAMLTEEYYDACGLYAEEKKIVRLDEDVTLAPVRDYFFFDKVVLLDGEAFEQKVCRFNEGKEHKIEYIADFDAHEEMSNGIGLYHQNSSALITTLQQKSHQSVYLVVGDIEFEGYPLSHPAYEVAVYDSEGGIVPQNAVFGDYDREGGNFYIEVAISEDYIKLTSNAHQKAREFITLDEANEKYRSITFDRTQSVLFIWKDASGIAYYNAAAVEAELGLKIAVAMDGNIVTVTIDKYIGGSEYSLELSS